MQRRQKRKDADEWSRAIDMAERDLLEIARLHGEQALIKVLRQPCDHKPGTAMRIATMSLRVQFEIPLHHKDEAGCQEARLQGSDRRG